MDKVILIRIGEIYLKGKNRSFFENMLVKNIKNKLFGVNCKFFFGRNRYIISDFTDENFIINKLKNVFGINSLSVGYKTKTDFDEIAKTALSICPKNGTFRVTANRADKTFKYNSLELSREIGGVILDNNLSLSVDLHNPDFTINIDIRENGFTYIFWDKIMGAGGMPVGCAGNGLLLLSGGIDSPVAGYMMAKRGMSLTVLHFHSYPYTSEDARNKVIKLAEMLKEFCPDIKLIFVSATKIQEAINKYCDNNYLITILRRFMMRLAEKVAQKNDCACLINGESLGQVASQTIQSITVTNDVVKDMPILRPLIGMDKQDIINIAEKIGTYQQSILPYEDCCTVFLPKNPVTRPDVTKCEFEENKIPNFDELVEEALANFEIIKI